MAPNVTDLDEVTRSHQSGEPERQHGLQNPEQASAKNGAIRVERTTSGCVSKCRWDLL